MTENTKNPGQFILDNIAWGLIAIFSFYHLCLREISLPLLGIQLSKDETITLFVLFSVILIELCILMTYNDRRNGFTVAVNVLLPLAIFSWFSISQFFPLLAKFLLVLAFAGLLVLGNFIFKHKISQKADRSLVLKNRFKVFAQGSRIILGISFIACVFLLLGGKIGLLDFVAVNTVAGNQYQSEDSLLKQHYDQLKLLEDDTWKDLSSQERLQVLQVITDIETVNLGLPGTIQVMGGMLEEGACGQYNHGRRLITIDLDHLFKANSGECLETVIHEVYHSYQRYLCDSYNALAAEYQNLKLYDEVRLLAENFENYIDDGERYYDQPVEITARNYAYSNAPLYFEKLDRIKVSLPKTESI